MAPTLLLVVPENPATLPLRPLRQHLAPILGQDWRLFAPDLNTVEAETVVSAEFTDGQESPPIALGRAVRDASLHGVRRFFPSRVVSLLEISEIRLNNAVVVSRRISGIKSAAGEGDPIAQRVRRDPRFQQLVRANETRLRGAQRDYENVVARLAPLFFDGKRVARLRAHLIVSFESSRRRMTDFIHLDPVDYLEDLEHEIAQSLTQSAVLVDTGWFELNTARMP